MRRKRAHERGVRVACDGTDVDEALLAEGELEHLLACVVLGDHGVVLRGFECRAGTLVENDGAAVLRWLKPNQKQSILSVFFF